MTRFAPHVLTSLRLVLVVWTSVAWGAFAANHCIRAGATGAADGSSWSDAFTDIPASLVRGDTYFVAAGAYHWTIINQAVSGTTWIYFKKATVAAHGTDTGWDNSYATGQAIWTNGGESWDLRTSYLDFDGVTGSGKTGHGFKLVNTRADASEQGCVTVYNGQTATHVNLSRIEMVGSGTDVDQLHRNFGVYNLQNGGSDWTISLCYIHDVYVWIQSYQLQNVLIDHCWLSTAGSSSPDHAAGITFQGDNFTLRYTVLENMTGVSNTTYVEPQTTQDGVYIYGNVYWEHGAGMGTTQWGNFSKASSSSANNLYFYNNTSYGMLWPGVNPGTVANAVIRNNVWQDCAISASLNGTTISDNINNAGGVSFTDSSSGDFHLASATTAGVTLASPYNLDPDGNTRGLDGNWDLGAYEYTGGLPVPPTKLRNVRLKNAIIR